MYLNWIKWFVGFAASSTLWISVFIPELRDSIILNNSVDFLVQNLGSINTQSIPPRNSQSNGENKPINTQFWKACVRVSSISWMVDKWLLFLMLLKNCFKYYIIFRNCYYEGMFIIAFLGGSSIYKILRGK